MCGKKVSEVQLAPSVFTSILRNDNSFLLRNGAHFVDEVESISCTKWRFLYRKETCGRAAAGGVRHAALQVLGALRPAGRRALANTMEANNQTSITNLVF